MSPFRAGAARHYVAIQAPTHTAAGGGATTSEWATIENGAVWMAFEPSRGREGAVARSVQSLGMCLGMCRYVADVKPQQRVLFGSRAFLITSILNHDEVNATLELALDEVPLT